MGKLVRQAGIRVIAGTRRIGAQPTLSKVGVVRGHGLGLTRSWVAGGILLLSLALGVVARRSVAVLLLLLLLRRGQLLFLLRLTLLAERVDRLRKGGGSCRIGSIGGRTKTGARVVANVEVKAVPLIVHGGRWAVGRWRRGRRGGGHGGRGRRNGRAAIDFQVPRLSESGPNFQFHCPQCQAKVVFAAV